RPRRPPALPGRLRVAARARASREPGARRPPAPERARRPRPHHSPPPSGRRDAPDAGAGGRAREPAAGGVPGRALRDRGRRREAGHDDPLRKPLPRGDADGAGPRRGPLAGSGPGRRGAAGPRDGRGGREPRARLHGVRAHLEPDPHRPRGAGGGGAPRPHPAAIGRAPVVRVPYAFWRHFPDADRSPRALADATLAFHARWGSDFIKLTPAGGYAVREWGCVESGEVSADGHRPCATCGVQSPADWAKIRPLDPAAAHGYAQQVETLIRMGGDGRVDCAILPTLFSPLSVARKLSGDRLAADLREHPE